MFGARLRTDCTAQTKNGPAAQTTTGVASASSTHGFTLMGNGGKPNIAIDRTASDRGSATQNRRSMCRYSCSAESSSSVGVIGSRCIPQIGQRPGASRMISGCIGQV